MNIQKKIVCAPIATLTLIGSLIGGANAATTIEIYDDFEWPSSYNLNGSTANTGQTWSGGHTSNGSEISVKNGPLVSSITGISLSTNTEYILSMDVNVSSTAANTSDWFGFGFRTASFANLTSGTVGAMLHRFDPEVQTFSSNGANQQTTAASSGLQTLSITLQTGATLANSSLTWKVDGVQAGVSQTTDASAVNGVFIHTIDDARGTIDNFTLSSEPVPEPSSSALLGLGGLALIMRRKRR